jgi:dethiobiotin synthase
VLRGVFVTGTDTGVGKTIACAALMHRYRPVARVRYWKPVQTGIECDDDTAVVESLGACGREELLREGIRLRHPLSPHLSARLEGVTISIDELAAIASAQSLSDRWIVEGAGGALVPLNDRELMVDLIARLDLSVVVVSRTTLGTINHTLLTLEALRTRGIEVAGVLLVGDSHPNNRDAIERYGRVEILGELPMIDPLTPAALKRSEQTIDPGNRAHAILGVQSAQRAEAARS